jgi:cyclopropane-fatty-acyl-phospholipid synthase
MNNIAPACETLLLSTQWSCLMTSVSAKQAVEGLLDTPGITIGGSGPFDIRVHVDEFYPEILSGGSLALGESYMAGWWDCEALDQFFDRILGSRLDKRVRTSRDILWAALKARLTGAHMKRRSFEIGKRHYDIGNELFGFMLDRRMNYSCGFWEGAGDLETAQENKLELICRKLDLTPGMKVLDIGCGWGGFAVFAAERYDVEVTGITVSCKQVELAKQLCRGLPVQIRLEDYRDLRGTFDRIVSIGMFEHVCAPNYRRFMRTVHRCLLPGGIFLLHTIGSNTSVNAVDPWIEKYIFPNSMLPSARQITAAAEGLFVLEDWHSFGHHYDLTLMAWHRNFITYWDRIRHLYDQRFYRMWTYYLLCSAGSFRARRNQLWQIVFSKGGIRGGYRSIRQP